MKLLFSLFLIIVFASASGQGYNYYYGNIHAHSGFSDGNVDSNASGISQPGPSYWYASQSYNFNFLGISDHNHSGAGMRLIDYARGLYQADTANHNGQFVSMYGIEYGVINNGGHVIVYGVDSLIGWENNNYQIFNGQFDYASLWKTIARRPKAFATTAHPRDDDFSNLANSPYVDTSDLALVGVPIRTGAAFSTTTNYNDPPPATVYETYWRKLLALGYHVGATIDHDNHYTTFGRTARSRTTVLASVLHRDSIMDAYRKMRFYASDDWNVQVNFTINAYPVGSIFTSGVDPTINILVTDADAGDNVSSIHLFYGVPGSGVLSTLLNGSSTNALSYVHPVNTGAKYYYYAVITQADGNKVWTSPIWMEKIGSLPVTLLSFEARVVHHSIRIEANILANEAFQRVDIEKGYRGFDFRAIHSFTGATANAKNFHHVDEQPMEGYQYYRLRFTSLTGEVSFTKTIAVNYRSTAYSISAAATTRNNLVVQIKSPIPGNTTVILYNASGQLVLSKNIMMSSSDYVNEISTSHLQQGFYILVVQFGNQVRRECKVVL